jgi:predicted GNAT family acetyltransferase
MIRKAGPADAQALAAFLEQHIETSMFLLGNLAEHGTGNLDHPHGTRFYLRETSDGIKGVFGCTNGGFLMCQQPGITVAEAQAYAELLHGYRFQGMTGRADQVLTVLRALPIDPNHWSCNRSEPLYTLDLADIAAPDVDLRLPRPQDTATLINWFEQYLTETTGAQENASERAKRAVQNGQHMIMWEHGTPTAMTGINARYQSTVQIGSVFVPPHARGQGRAGRAILAHLNRLKAQDGVSKAVLFAASDKAARAYERIGFGYQAEFQVAVMKAPQQLEFSS